MGGDTMEIVSIDNYFRKLCYERKQRSGAVTRKKSDHKLSDRHRMEDKDH